MLNQTSKWQKETTVNVNTNIKGVTLQEFYEQQMKFNKQQLEFNKKVSEFIKSQLEFNNMILKRLDNVEERLGRVIQLNNLKS